MLTLIQGNQYIIDGDLLTFDETIGHGEVAIFKEVNNQTRIIKIKELFDLTIVLVEEDDLIYQCDDCKKILEIYQIEDTGGFCPYCASDQIKEYEVE